jgi:hypothetical protein
MGGQREKVEEWVGGRMDIRGVYMFSSLMKQNKKAKICFVICFAGKKKLLFYIYAVIVKQKIYKRSSNYYSVGGESLQINPLQTRCHQLPLGFLAAGVVGKAGEGAKVDARRGKSPLHLPENVSCAGRWDASRQRAQMATRMRKRSTQQSKLSVRVQTRTVRAPPSGCMQRE